MKKIFHFVSTNILGGLEQMVINISTLVRGNDYTYVSPDGPINKILKHYGIKHISIPNMNPVSVRHVIKRYRPNIVQGHDVKASLSLAINYNYCHNHNIRVISELHSDDPRMKKPFKLRSFLYALSSFFYDDIILVSNPIMHNYYYANLIRDKVHIIYDVINPMSLKAYMNIYNKKIWDCIFLGRLSREKNPIKFIKIIYQLKKYIPNIKAIIVGNGILLPTMKKVVYSYNLINNITFVGFKSNPYYYLNKSKMLIMPSKYEGFGLSALESLLLGIPVIASPTGGLKDIVDKKCGDFAISVKDFAKKAYLLIINKKIYNKKVVNAVSKGKAINNVNKFVLKYNNIYK